jgi:hypothetical protein
MMGCTGITAITCLLVSSKVGLAVGILTLVVATVCGWWWHYVLLRESKARTSSNKKAPLPPGSLGLPLLGETLEFLRLTQADKSAEFLNPRVAIYGQVRAQNSNPFLVPPPLNPSFLPPIQFRFLSEVSRNPMPGIQFKISRFEYWDFSCLLNRIPLHSIKVSRFEF